MSPLPRPTDIHTCHAGCPCHTGGTPAPDFFEAPVCSLCNGEGSIAFLHVPGDPQTEDSATCPDCHGSGLREAAA